MGGLNLFLKKQQFQRYILQSFRAMCRFFIRKI